MSENETNKDLRVYSKDFSVSSNIDRDLRYWIYPSMDVEDSASKSNGSVIQSIACKNAVTSNVSSYSDTHSTSSNCSNPSNSSGDSDFSAFSFLKGIFRTVARHHFSSAIMSTFGFSPLELFVFTTLFNQVMADGNHTVSTNSSSNTNSSTPTNSSSLFSSSSSSSTAGANFTLDSPIYNGFPRGGIDLCQNSGATECQQIYTNIAPSRFVQAVSRFTQEDNGLGVHGASVWEYGPDLEYGILDLYWSAHCSYEKAWCVR